MSFLSDRHADAIGLVSAWLEQNCAGAAPLESAQRTQLWSAATDGWEWPFAGDGAAKLAMLIDADFPYSIPRFFLRNSPELERGPHLEASGRLCLAGDGGRVDALDPAAVVAHQYNEAITLLAQNAKGHNRDDYQLDFEAYWRRDQTSNRQILTWVRRLPVSRIAAAFHGQQYYFIAEDADDCQLWLNNRFGPAERTFQPAAVIWMSKLPEPDAYPASAHAVRRLIQAHSTDGLPAFDKLMIDMADRAAVVLMAQVADDRIAQAVALIDKPDNLGTGKAPSVPVDRGFRPGHTPPSVLAMRRTARRSDSERVDAWLTRTSAEEGERLGSKRVAIIGCGSLGGGVVRLLLQSGVGNMLLVDPDKLAWANIGRHELGANFIKQNKATTLADLLRKSIPHVRSLQGEPVEWQALLRANAQAFAEYDVILSLTGDWNSESALNDLQRSGTGQINAPILYGWMERQVGAAHVLGIGQSGACLRCGFSSTGSIALSATRWPAGPTEGCGAPNNLYGAIELTPAQSLVATATIDVLMGRATPPFRRTWLATARLIEASGGSWNPAWLDRYGDPGPGGVLTATAWPEEAACPCPHITPA